MFNVPQSKINEFEKLFSNHRLNISACDVYYANVKMLMVNARNYIMKRDDFVQYYKNFTWDIDLETSPIDAFVPITENEQPTENKRPKLFVVNQTVPEWGRIKNRIPIEELKQTLPETHPVIVALNNNEMTLDDVIDEIFSYWCLYKYLNQIDNIRMAIFSNMTPLIEYVVENIGYAQLKSFLRTDKVNLEKIEKHDDLVFFEADYSMICDFYEKNEEPEFSFNMKSLIERLITNIDLKSDIYIILGIYLAASFAVSDIKAHTESPCANYVKDTLTIL